MTKPVFKSYPQGQVSLFPKSLDEKIPLDSPTRLINQIVEELNIDSLINTYQGGGTSSYHPRMMLKVLFLGYLNNIYSCRKIDKQLKENIHYMWLSGNQEPDFRTINNFRSKRLKDTVNDLFTQVVLLLVDMGYLSLDVQYSDGTKMESVANRYTFVWRKSVEKYKARLEIKIQSILDQVQAGIYADNQAVDEVPMGIDSQDLKKRIAGINKENRSKEDLKAIKILEQKHLPKLQAYEIHLATMGADRNSYSKTDPEATFMRMKEDHMRNGQLKPAYNLQLGTQNQFITNFAYCQDRDDTLTLPRFMDLYHQRYGKYMNELCADAGYGSEQNYEYLQGNEIEAYVKFSYFHKEQKRSYKNNPFLQDNLYYNAQEDYFVCPMGQHMTCKGKAMKKNNSGYQSQISYYQAQNCWGCPLRTNCHKAQGDRIISVNHVLRYYKQKARENLTSKKGLEHRSKRPVEVEAVFGQIKFNKQYNRLRHIGIYKITMDFAIFAIAFNIAKLGMIMSKYKKNKASDANKMKLTFFVCIVYTFSGKKVDNNQNVDQRKNILPMVA